MKVYYASKAIAVDTPPYKHWLAKREEVDDIQQISWDDFVTLLYDGLGSKEARTTQVYYSHMEARWDPDKGSILQFMRRLKSYEEAFLDPLPE